MMFTPKVRLQGGHLVMPTGREHYIGGPLGRIASFIRAVSLDDAWLSYCVTNARHLLPPAEKLPPYLRRVLAS